MIEVGCRDLRYTLVIWVSMTDLLYTVQGSEQNMRDICIVTGVSITDLLCTAQGSEQRLEIRCL